MLSARTILIRESALKHPPGRKNSLLRKDYQQHDHRSVPASPSTGPSGNVWFVCVLEGAGAVNKDVVLLMKDLKESQTSSP
ncbi:hypothetical protein DL768_001492 [Monosporascus sp. mg162]|nr:hypothetical protein DL768_001492 [Monosporascus sp. mg162]